MCVSTVCVLPCSQSSGLHCISASVEIGNMLFTASKALLAALATLAAIGKQRKAASAERVGGQSKSKESRPKALTGSVLEKVVAILPDQVGTKDPAQHHPAGCLYYAVPAQQQRATSTTNSMQTGKRGKLASGMSGIPIPVSILKTMQMYADLVCLERSSAHLPVLIMHVVLLHVHT